MEERGFEAYRTHIRERRASHCRTAARGQQRRPGVRCGRPGGQAALWSRVRDAGGSGPDPRIRADPGLPAPPLWGPHATPLVARVVRVLLLAPGGGPATDSAVGGVSNGESEGLCAAACAPPAQLLFDYKLLHPCCSPS